MRFKGLDLNLLCALDILLEELSVSRAAERMHVSQPAMSAALGRLRAYFDDPLLVVDGKRMIPTPHALRLRKRVRLLLGDVEALISVSSDFDPRTSNRTFRIGASDYITAVIFCDLLQEFSASAPGIMFEFFAPSDDTSQMLAQGEIDLLTGPDGLLLHDHPSELFFEERHVVAGWSGNPVFGQEMSEADFSQAAHIAVQIGSGLRLSFAESELRKQGIERKIAVTASSFSVVPDLLIHTDRLAVMHERMAAYAAIHRPIAYAPMPFEFPPMREIIQYHRARSDDVGLRWLISALVTLAKRNQP